MTQELTEAVNCLKSGNILLYPTDTVWGLGCDALSPEAVKKTVELKQRPAEKSMIILVSDVNMLGRYFKEIPDVLFDLEEHSDKPITYILDNPVGIASGLVHPDGSLGVRIPKHDFCIQLIRKFGKAIVSTSANLSGQPSPASYHDIDPIIKQQAGYCVAEAMQGKATGQPSTIIKIKANGEFSFIRK